METDSGPDRKVEYNEMVRSLSKKTGPGSQPQSHELLTSICFEVRVSDKIGHTVWREDLTNFSVTDTGAVLQDRCNFSTFSMYEFSIAIVMQLQNVRPAEFVS